MFFIFWGFGWRYSLVQKRANPSSHKYASIGSKLLIKTYNLKSNFFLSIKIGVFIYLYIKRSEWWSLQRFLGIYLNLSIRNIPSPPLPEFGLHMNVNLGCCSIYASRLDASSGRRKLIGENPNYLSNVFLIRFVTEQNTFLRAMYSIRGYLL